MTKTNKIIPEEIIKIAIEGGWKYLGKVAYSDYENPQLCILNWQMIILDSYFWKALGKVKGWGEIEIFMDDYTNNHPFLCGTLDYPYSEGAGMTYTAPREKYEALRFINLLLTEQDTESFWGEIIK